MTIMIERDSPLRVIDTSSPQGSSGAPYDPASTAVEEGFVVVDYTPYCSSLPVGKLRSSTSIDDDTASTGSLSSDNSSEGYQDKRVTFTQDIVSDIWTRPFTPREEISNLFYSTEETSRYVFHARCYGVRILTLESSAYFVNSF